MTAVEKGLTEGNLPDGTAAKLLDLYTKAQGSAKPMKPQTMIPSRRFNGSGAELVAEISGFSDEARAMSGGWPT
jgi:hypothetical protein